MTWAFSCLGYIYQKKRKDESTNPITYILNASSLVSSSGGEQRCWDFISGERTSRGENIETAELKKTNRLHLKGAISMSELTTGVAYEVVFVVKLKNGGCGWEHPVTLKLSVRGERGKVRQVNLYEQPRGEWVELKVGDFIAEEVGEVTFHLLQEGSHVKKGLLLQSAVVRPKS